MSDLSLANLISPLGFDLDSNTAHELRMLVRRALREERERCCSAICKLCFQTVRPNFSPHAKRVHEPPENWYHEFRYDQFGYPGIAQCPAWEIHERIHQGQWSIENL